MSEIVIVGSGPTGLMLAAELTLAGAEVEVLERRRTPQRPGSRAGGFHTRTLEILDQRGIVDRFLAAGTPVQTTRFGDTTLDMHGFPTRHPYGLGLWQHQIERILLDRATELGVRIRYGVEVTGLTQDEDGVDVHLADAGRLRTSYLVGADGGRSAVRRAAGIERAGWDATRSHLIAEVEVREEFPPGIRQDADGIHALQLLEDGRTVRVMVTERELGPATEPTLEDLAAAVAAVYGSDFGMHHPTWISRFTNATRQAVAYRRGRVLLAGDAAHVHHPAGGQGIGLGLQDAVNLGWKLAQVAQGRSPDALLDTYHAERHPAGARVLRHTMAQSALQGGDVRTQALREAVAEMLSFPQPAARTAGLISGLDVAYDLGEGHPLLGRRMPDLDLVTPDGPVRVYPLLHAVRPVLLDLAGPDRGGPDPDGPGLALTGWEDRVQHVRARYDGPWELPVIGPVGAPAAVLVRPDGHVAWVGDGTPGGLTEVLTTWCGPPRR